jgi:hypothetical protein
MAIVLMIFGVAFAALCVWLMVRIINRRERWAKWTAIAVSPAVIYFGAYLVMVEVAPFYFLVGEPPYELHPRYGVGPVRLDHQFWKEFFGPAHWIDRRMRRKMWMIGD